jgi:hypothetical protein
MNWLKRNLLLALGGVGALLLLGAAGYYLYTQIQKESSVSAQLETQINDWRRLTTRNPSATQENIQLARAEQVKLADLLKTTQRHFVPASTRTNIDSATFKSDLETTIARLNQHAQRQGVAVAPGYGYTFDWARRTITFDAAELLPLAHQLAEIEVICELLFEARVHSISRLRRAPVSRRDQGSNEYLQGIQPVTNAVTRAVVVPYEITFQGFTSELAAVLNSVQRSPHCIVVKLVDVENSGPAPSPEQPRVTPMPWQPMPTPGPTPRSGEDLMRERYGAAPGGRDPYGGMRGPGGFQDRYRQPPGTGVGPGGFPPTQLVPRTGPVRRGPETVLDEELLKVRMLVELIRLPPSTE